MSEYALVKIEKHMKDGKPTCEGCPFFLADIFEVCPVHDAIVPHGCPVHASEPSRLLRDAIGLLGEVYCTGRAAVRCEQALAKLREVGQ